MYRRLALLLSFATVLLFSIFACQEPPAAEADLPTAARLAPSATPAAGASATIRATRAATMPPPAAPTDTPTTIPSPTGTPQQPLVIAVPSHWELEARRAAEALSSNQEWVVLVVDDPQRALDQGDVQAALLPGEQGFAAGNRPLALAVPFTSEWQNVTHAEALDIQANGHDYVSLVSWDVLSVAQRPLTIDGQHATDPAYPLQQPWSVHAAPDVVELADQFARALQNLAEAGDLKVAAVGDIMLDRSLGAAVASGDAAYPFSFVATTLQDADLTIGNLECALGDTGEPAQKSYTFRAPPAAAHSLAVAGFDLVSLANNHALDFGPQALLQGIALLHAEGIATVGAGTDHESAHQAHVVEVNGITLGLLGYVNVPVEGGAPYFDTASWRAGPQSAGLAWADPATLAADVQDLRNKVDHVVVILHSGYEYVPSPSPEQAASARAAIDAGATLVIGHHAHILQGVEFRGAGAIVYGLGNFAFNITGPAETAILNAWFDENGLRQIRFIPAVVQASGQPMITEGADAEAVLGQIYNLSRSLN